MHLDIKVYIHLFTYIIYQNNDAHITRLTCKKHVIAYQGLAESVTLGTLGYSESTPLT